MGWVAGGKGSRVEGYLHFFPFEAGARTISTVQGACAATDAETLPSMMVPESIGQAFAVCKGMRLFFMAKPHPFLPKWQAGMAN